MPSHGMVWGCAAGKFLGSLNITTCSSTCHAGNMTSTNECMPIRRATLNQRPSASYNRFKWLRLPQGAYNYSYLHASGSDFGLVRENRALHLTWSSSKKKSYLCRGMTRKWQRPRPFWVKVLRRSENGLLLSKTCHSKMTMFPTILS